MKDINVRRFEMCVRCDGYLAEHPPAFSDGSLGAQLVNRFAAVVDEIQHHTASGKLGSAMSDTTAKQIAREKLTQMLDKISRCARGMAVTVPELEKRFQLPRRNGDLTLLDVAKSFADNATPLLNEFVQFEMAPSFIDDLKRQIAAFDQAMVRCTDSRSSKVVTTKAIGDAVEQAVEILVQLDPIMHNKLESNPTLLSQWENVRHIERASRPAKPAPSKDAEPKPQPQI